MIKPLETRCLNHFLLQKKIGEGTGLGLAVVKKIADEHHADVRLRNLERDGVVEGAQVSVSFSAVQTQVA